MSHSFVSIAKSVWIKWQFKLSFLSVVYLISFLVPALYTLIIMLDTCVILQVVWIVGVFRGGAKLSHFITQKRWRGVSSLRKCSFDKNYTPNCHIEEIRCGSILKIISHFVTLHIFPYVNLVIFLGKVFWLCAAFPCFLSL